MSATVSHATPATITPGGAGVTEYNSQLSASYGNRPSPGNMTHPGKCGRQITPRTVLGLQTPQGCTQPLQYDKANALDINLKEHEGKRLKNSKCTYFNPLGAINHLWSGVVGTGGSFVQPHL